MPRAGAISLNGPLYVNYGCGWTVAEGWINFDASPTLRFERVPILGLCYKKNKERFPPSVIFGDIVRGLPLPPRSCQGVFASHVLEHLALEDFRIALHNTHALMRDGAFLRVVVPDLRLLARRYLDSPHPLAAADFMRATALGSERRPGGLVDRLARCFGRSAHQWMWDFESLRFELEKAGFHHIRRCSIGDAPDPMFQRVEAMERFRDAVAVECQR